MYGLLFFVDLVHTQHQHPPYVQISPYSQHFILSCPGVQYALHLPGLVGQDTCRGTQHSPAEGMLGYPCREPNTCQAASPTVLMHWWQPGELVAKSLLIHSPDLLFNFLQSWTCLFCHWALAMWQGGHVPGKQWTGLSVTGDRANDQI